MHDRGKSAERKAAGRLQGGIRRRRHTGVRVFGLYHDEAGHEVLPLRP